MDLADNTADCKPLERVPEDIDGKIDRQTYTLEQLAKWKAEAEHYKFKYEQLLAGVTEQTVKGVRREQIITILLGRVPAPTNDASQWRFSREELNAAPTRSLRIGELPDGGAFVEL